MLGFLSTLGLLTGYFAPPPPAVQAGARQTIRVQRRIVIRVPRLAAMRTAASSAPLPPIRWVERAAGRCIPADSLAGATVTRPDSIDLVLAGGRRMRATLGNQCPALDFYDGFYLRRTEDGMVCAARDSFRSRSGGECPIEGFRALVPAR